MDKRVNIINKIKTLFESQEWLKIRDAIKLLSDNTGEDLIFDPYKDADRLMWNDIGMFFLKAGHIMESLSVFQSQLQRYFDIQAVTKKRIHKGTPYHFLGQVYLQISNLGSAREQFLMAFIEDILTEMEGQSTNSGAGKVIGNAFDCPAPIILELTFRMKRNILDDLYNFTKNYLSNRAVSELLYPEQVLLGWRNHKEKQKGNDLLVTRAVEESLFHIINLAIK
jgi:hypothetical protein